MGGSMQRIFSREHTQTQSTAVDADAFFDLFDKRRDERLHPVNR